MGETSDPTDGSGLNEPSEAGHWALWMVPEWDELLVSTLELTATLLRARWCALVLFFDQELIKLGLARLWDGRMGVVARSWQAGPNDLEWRVARSLEAVACVRAGGAWLGEQPPADPEGRYPCACAAVELESTCFGAVEVVREPGGEPFVPAELEALGLVARNLALALRNGTLFRRLGQLASTDGLTRVYNYRYFQDRLEAEVERAGRYGRSVSLIMLDVDQFKRYNDRYGHEGGDTALRLVASTIQRAVRRVDVVARYGGDEFAVILPEAGSQQALAAATRIANAVREHQGASFDVVVEKPVSVSMGVSSYPALAQTKGELIRQADEALYRAKRSRTRMIWLWEAGRRRFEPQARACGRLL